MAWLLLIALLLVAVFFEAWRRAVAVLLLLCAAIGVAYYLFDESLQAESRELIAVSDIAIEGAVMAEAHGSYDFSARLFNHSEQHTLAGFQLLLGYYDCPEQGPVEKALAEPAISDCVRIGEDQRFISLIIPPGQARDFSLNAYHYGRLQPRGQLRWRYTVDYVQARR